MCCYARGSVLYAFGMAGPVAYFLTWTCRGARLHGDAKGSVDRAHNGFGSPLVQADAWREAGELARMGDVSKVVLAPEHQSVVHAAVSGVCEHRSWKLLALAVRSNHVHLVVNAPRHSPESVMQLCKSWATRRLREAGVFDSQAPVWTRHGSTRYIWDESGLSEALDYVVNQQDNRRRFRNETEPRA